MSNPKKVKTLQPAPYNPRKISDKKLEMLAVAMKEFGDLSGVVFNRRTGNLIGGHQRVKIFDADWEIKKEPIEDDLGTVGEGFIETPYGRWIYREVDWDKKKEMAANVAANKHGGEWDFPLLSDVLLELDTGEFDMELTGFDEQELEKFFTNNSEGITLGQQTFELIVECENEKELEDNFNKLKSEGYKCRPLIS